MIDHFRDNWLVVSNALAEMPMDQIIENLGWDDYQERFQAHEATKDKWIADFEDWVSVCYPAPEDRVVKTSDQICLYGMTSTIIKDGEQAAKDMWFKFFLPIVEEYGKLTDKKENYETKHELLKDMVYNTGHPHSFRCEFVFLRTRVRYFEIIPNWEL